jgi:hypothetical protein
MHDCWLLSGEILCLVNYSPLPSCITFDCKTPGLHGFASKIAAINELGVIDLD